MTDHSRTNITEGHRMVFRALTSGLYREDFALMSCFVNDRPAVAIAAVHETEDHYEIVPLFVAITPGMDLTDHDGVRVNRPGLCGAFERVAA